MISVREIIILSALTVVKCQYEYYRPDSANFRRTNQFGNNDFGEEFGPGNDKIVVDEVPGRAGTDYPVFSEIPETGFQCDRQRYPGYYADPGTGCQVFHICQRGGRSDSFLCPNGTIFNQEWLVCDWWYNFDCSNAENLYSVNEQVFRAMEEADLNLQDSRYNSFRKFRLNDSTQNRPYQNGINSEYGLPGVPSFGRSPSGYFGPNTRDSGFGPLAQRNFFSGNPSFSGPAVPGANFGKNRATPNRNYLPPRK